MNTASDTEELEITLKPRQGKCFEQAETGGDCDRNWRYVVLTAEEQRLMTAGYCRHDKQDLRLSCERTQTGGPAAAIRSV